MVLCAFAAAAALNGMFVSPAGAGRGDCKETEVKKFFAKNAVKTMGCHKEGLEDISAITRFGRWPDATFHGSWKPFLSLAKHVDGYYFMFVTEFTKAHEKGSYSVRAADDPFVIELRDGNQMTLKAVRDATPFWKSGDERMCAIYHITKSELETLSSNEFTIQVKQFIKAVDGYERRFQKQTEDGRDYFHWTPSSGWLSQKATCALKFN